MMTIRQNILKKLYPLLMQVGKNISQSKKIINTQNIKSHQSIYSLQSLTINNQWFNFNSCQNKKILIVNTASNCGYTAQFNELQILHTKFNDRLIVLGFPSNDFKQQESADNDTIAQFCKINFGVTFQLMKKCTVQKNEPDQHPVYKWLTNIDQNGWNNQEPEWNFCKYLIDENGILTHYFPQSVSPLDASIISAITK